MVNLAVFLEIGLLGIAFYILIRDLMVFIS